MKRWLVPGAALFVSSLGGVLVASAQTTTVATPSHAATAPVVAPYLDVSVSGRYSQLFTAIRHHGLRNVTAAFVIGHGCTPTWDDSLPVATDTAVNGMIAKARREGAHVIVSFGGQARSELATSCTSTSKLTAAYRSVIDKLHATDVDFDIEGAAIAEPASIARRFAALHSLQRAHRNLSVSLTLPVEPNGLDTNGRAILRSAKRHKVDVSLVNVMAMDYGSPTSPEMGTAAMSAARHTLTQLRRVWPHDGYRNLGITPMVGHNDSFDETFSLADARRVAAFARSHHVGRLAFWSLARDERCSAPTTSAQSDCSSVQQSDLAFTRAFLG